MRKLLLLCATLIAAFTAGAQCVASFTYSATPSGNNLLNISFTNTSSYGLPFTGQKKTAAINYGDGSAVSSSGNTTLASHNYAFPGTYAVGVRIYSYDTTTTPSPMLICTDTVTVMVMVAYPSCATRITTTGTGASRTFTATTPAGSGGRTYNWTFGDGGTGSGATVSHTYAAAGFYTVTLSVSAGAPLNCTYTNSVLIYISIPPAPLNCSNLHASFIVGVLNNVASVTNTSTALAAPYYSVATWDYGDGGTATGLNPPPHTYTAPGVYSIRLAMQWRDTLLTTSCRDTAYRTATITTIPTPPNVISGNVIYNSATYGTNFFKVWLIKFDSATNLLSAIDSQITANTAAPYYAFSPVAAGSYRTKAAVYLGSNSGTGIVPTYHDSTTYWNVATVINHTGGSTTNRNINMRTGTISSGPGFIGGNVSLGANKGADNGVRGVMIFLRNSTTRVVEVTLTDAMGNYSFSNLPYGAYSVYPEELNYSTIPVTPIVLNAALASRPDVNFTKNSTQLSIRPSNMLGVSTANAGGLVSVFPNPASDKVTISWQGQADADNEFTITGITGNIVARSAAVRGAKGSVDINISGLAAGVYIVHGSGKLAGNVTRLIIR